MPGEDQERFEDYLELERFIAEIQAGHAAHPPQELTPAQARVYRMAMLFHAATPGVSEPDPDFATRLQERLEQELQTLPASPAPITTQPPVLSSAPRPKRRLPRRLLLTGGVSAAASIALTAGATHMVDMAMRPRSPGREITVSVASPMDWFRVTTVADMGDKAVKFRAVDQNGALSLTGYVLRSDQSSIDNDPSDNDAIKKGEIIAMSAACTHKGCIVEWSDIDRKFHCPCHGGVFNGTGGLDQSASSLNYLERLPLLDVDVRSNGEIYVRMPAL